MTATLAREAEVSPIRSRVPGQRRRHIALRVTPVEHASLLIAATRDQSDMTRILRRWLRAGAAAEGVNFAAID
ncbi:hypothetical protein [Synechococcus sp. CBW1107]|uniref:hypothetical protein n=1 Tax=Synechococcus sp. CBW1107 TaxID=2789857 RepID=UPI002AD56D7A|nr:hypothetical protein [Synechococcus sp. CBW1107]